VSPVVGCKFLASAVVEFPNLRLQADGPREPEARGPPTGVLGRHRVDHRQFANSSVNISNGEDDTVKRIEWKRMDRPTHPFDLHPEESWGEVVSTSQKTLHVEELPVQVSVLVHNGWFVGLRGPSRLLDAICNYMDEALSCCADVPGPSRTP
jgi:hypothetical protein